MKLLNELVQAAAHLQVDADDFSEWDLTVSAFRICPQGFSMRGYPQYPDHKRVAMDLMAHTRRDSYDHRANGAALFFRTAPNRYKLSDTGWRRLWPKAVLRAWDCQAFLLWQKNPENPTLIDIFKESLEWIGTSPQSLRQQIEALPSSAPEASLPRAQLSDWLTAMQLRFGDLL